MPLTYHRLFTAQVVTHHRVKNILTTVHISNPKRYEKSLQLIYLELVCLSGPKIVYLDTVLYYNNFTHCQDTPANTCSYRNQNCDSRQQGTFMFKTINRIHDTVFNPLF